VPLYHFHLSTPGGIELDQLGGEMCDLDHAYLEACRAIPGIVSELIVGGFDPALCAFHITGDDGGLLMVVPLLERVPRRIQPKPDAIPDGPERPDALFDRLDGLNREMRALTATLSAHIRETRREIARFRLNDWALSRLQAGLKQQPPPTAEAMGSLDKLPAKPWGRLLGN
jgi:hypothetical protein